MPVLRRMLALLVFLFAAPGIALTQASGPAAPASGQNAALRAYLDCHEMGCDREFFVTEMKWVNWMRDRLDAEFHILVTSQATGSGGRKYTVVTIGQKQYAGKADTLTYTSEPNDADDVRRRALLRVMSQLLLPYAARTPLGSQLSVTFSSAPGGSGRPAMPARDKWNFWTFSISANGRASGERRQSSMYLSNNISANRITDDWKVTLGGNYSYDQSAFSLSDGTKFTNLQRWYGANALVVRSLTAHWSAGGRLNGSRSDYYNTDLDATAAGAVEWDYYPYEQFSRRKLSVLYSLGVQTYRFHRTTIYDRDAETRPTHSMNIGWSKRQRWGSASVSVNGSQYLNELKKNNVGVNGGFDIRMGRGFSFNMYASGSRVRDQLYLPRGEASNEEVIARQQALSTNYRFFSFVGLRYQFGSIFNSVVNPRFGSMGGGGGGMTIFSF
jgi:hypothetical protein